MIVSGSCFLYDYHPYGTLIVSCVFVVSLIVSGEWCKMFAWLDVMLLLGRIPQFLPEYSSEKNTKIRQYLPELSKK